MAKWSKSPGVQATMAAYASLFASIGVFLQKTMTSFKNFYFGPHKAYPYPYPDSRTAHLELFRDCGLTMLGIFVLAFTIQRVITAPHRY